MKSRNTLAVISLAIGMVMMPCSMAAPKGGSSIRIENLNMPAGALSSRAAAVNGNGTVVVGDAYWDVTFDYPKNRYAARWTPVSGTWRAEDLGPLLPRPSGASRDFTVTIAARRPL